MGSDVGVFVRRDVTFRVDVTNRNNGQISVANSAQSPHHTASIMTLPDDKVDDGGSSPEEAELERPLREVLGYESGFAPDDLAPPVDEGRLRRFLRDEGSPDEMLEVAHLVMTFRAWSEAARRVDDESA